MATGQSHQSPGKARLPLLSWEAGTLVSLKGGATQTSRELNKVRSEAPRAWPCARLPAWYRVLKEASLWDGRG